MSRVDRAAGNALEDGVGRELAYVKMSRAKDRSTVYVIADDAELPVPSVSTGVNGAPGVPQRRETGMDAHELGGLWVLREMWDFPSGVPEDDRVDYLKAIMACARAGSGLAPAEKDWVIGYGAACGAHQATIDALERYDGNEDVVAILERNMPVANTWGRVAVFDAIRACSADAAYSDDERAAVRREASRLGVAEEVVVELESLYEREQELKSDRIALVFGHAIPYKDRG